MNKRVTMLDIARACGLTKMTVSRVLSGSERVKPATRERVLAAAAELKYEMNLLARNLNLDRAGFVGIATPLDSMVGSQYFKDILKGARKVFAETDYDLALFDTVQEAADDGVRLAKHYRQRKVDGFLVVSQFANDHFITTLGEAGVPTVVVGEKPTDPEASYVVCNDRRGIMALCEHLHGLGHRRIAFVAGPREYATSMRRRKAYEDFCKKRNLDLPSWYLQTGDYQLHSGRAAGLTLLRAKPRPTAIIATNDLVASGVLESARELGLSVPRDISIVGFDDMEGSADRVPALTTVRQPVCEMGEMSARLLLQFLESKEIVKTQYQMDVSLVVRESSGPAPA